MLALPQRRRHRRRRHRRPDHQRRHARVGTGALSATVSDATTGNANVTAAEYFIDTAGANGTGTAMAGAFGTPTGSVTATIPAPTLAGPASGTHTVYVHGQDASGNWGALGFDHVLIDTAGPTTSGLTLTPEPVQRHRGRHPRRHGRATRRPATPTSPPPSTPSDGGATGGITMTRQPRPPRPSASRRRSRPVSRHEPHVGLRPRARTAAGNWGRRDDQPDRRRRRAHDSPASRANPPANNGSYGQSSTLAVGARHRDHQRRRLGQPAIAAGEGFIDTVGATGTGFPFTAHRRHLQQPHRDRLRGHPALHDQRPAPTATTPSTSTARTPAATGARPRRSPTSSTGRRPPSRASRWRRSTRPTAAGSPSRSTVRPIRCRAVSPAASPAASTGSTRPRRRRAAAPRSRRTGPTTIATTLTTGNHTVGVRVRDAAGNWSANTASGTVSTTVVAIFSNGFDTGGRPWGWSSASTNSNASA